MYCISYCLEIMVTNSFSLPYVGGGIFCEACAQFDLASSESSEFLRGCGGCYRGECPGDQLKRYIRAQLADQEVKDPFVKVITFGARIGETFGYKQGTPPSVPLKLFRGSKYGEDGRLVSAISPLPISGACCESSECSHFHSRVMN